MFDQLAVCPKLVIVGGKAWRDRWKVHPPVCSYTFISIMIECRGLNQWVMGLQRHKAHISAITPTHIGVRGQALSNKNSL